MVVSVNVKEYISFYFGVHNVNCCYQICFQGSCYLLPESIRLLALLLFVDVLNS